MKGKLGVSLVLLSVLVLLVTLVGCGSDTGTQASVSKDQKVLIQNLVAAHQSDDKAAMAALFAKDAVLEDHLANTTIEGRDKIVDYVAQYPGLDWRVNGDPFMVGPYVLQPMALINEGKMAGLGVHVYEINGDNQIKRFWVTVAPQEVTEP